MAKVRGGLKSEQVALIPLPGNRWMVYGLVRLAHEFGTDKGWVSKLLRGQGGSPQLLRDILSRYPHLRLPGVNCERKGVDPDA